MSVTNAPDNTAASVLFSDFLSNAGGFTGRTFDRSVCNLAVPLGPPVGFRVYELDYRGFVQASPGQTADVTDLTGNGTFIHVDGPATQDIRATIRKGATPGNDLAIATALDVNAGANPDEVLGIIDSIDILRIGSTTQESVQASIDQLATEHSAVTTHLSAAADLLLGFLEPIERPNQVSAFAAAGSPMLGATGNFDLTSGFSIFGGVAGFDQSSGGVQSRGTLFAGAIRYVSPIDETVDLFAEASVWGSPNVGLHFSRQYQNNGVTVSGEGDTSGAVAGAYGRAGAVFVPNEANQFVVSGLFGRSQISVNGYSETATAGNLFSATVAGHAVGANVVKATASWTGQVTPELDLTVSGAVGRTFGADGVTADVAFVGPVTGSTSDVTFVEYGARLGWNITPNASLNGFVFGATGDKIGTQTRFGGSLAVKF